MNAHTYYVERDNQDQLKKESFEIVRAIPALARLMSNPNWPRRNEFLMTDPIPRDPVTPPPPANPSDSPPPPATLPPEPRWPPRGDEIISPPTDKDTEPNPETPP